MKLITLIIIALCSITYFVVGRPFVGLMLLGILGMVISAFCMAQDED